MEVLPIWIKELEQRVEDSNIVDTFLDEISGEYN